MPHEYEIENFIIRLLHYRIPREFILKLLDHLLSITPETREQFIINSLCRAAEYKPGDLLNLVNGYIYINGIFNNPLGFEYEY